MASEEGRADTIAPVLLALFTDARKVGDSLFAAYERGKKDNWPMPLLSALKSGINAIAMTTNFELLPPESTRIKSEVAEIARFAKVLELPQAESLKAASEALKSL